MGDCVEVGRWRLVVPMGDCVEGSRQTSSTDRGLVVARVGVPLQEGNQR